MTRTSGEPTHRREAPDSGVGLCLFLGLFGGFGVFGVASGLGVMVFPVWARVRGLFASEGRGFPLGSVLLVW